MSETWKRWQDWATVVLGVALFLTPFVFATTDASNAAWTAYVGGVVLAIVGLWNLSSPDNRGVEWTEVVVGALLVLAPWVLGFSGLAAAAWSAWIAGALAVVLAGSVLMAGRNEPRLIEQH
jgi:ABC-type molybdate transport system permease subunit